MKANSKSFILKFAIFATGLSGIVAEYSLAKLANYFLGSSVFQWAMIISVMMFSMGVGSQISRGFKKNLLDKFIIIEFILSVFCSFAPVIIYGMSSQIQYTGCVVYSLSTIIGMLIGMEIPLVTRINEEYEELKQNIANVMALDYFGSLLGGALFSYIGIRYLGMTFTPFVFGSINLIVAIIMLIKFKSALVKRNKAPIFSFAFMVVVAFFVLLSTAKDLEKYSEQRRYDDSVVFVEETPYQKIVITESSDLQDNNLYINNNLQLSTKDEFLYHEPLVHPAMQLSKNVRNVLVLGGGDGCAIREILKYPSIQKIILVDLDPKMTIIGKNHPVFSELNEHSFDDKRVTVLNTDGFNYLQQSTTFYDLILVDLPDPKSIDLCKLYSREFYSMCYNRLSRYGHFVTQSGSPMFAFKAYKCIEKTMKAAGFHTLPTHNHVLSLGDWGFIIGSKAFTQEEMKYSLRNNNLTGVETKWLNKEAMTLITSFGKDPVDLSKLEVNTTTKPVLHDYYLHGRWDLF